MALPDLTGQNIQDTYQRVLTVGTGGNIFDGTGSLFLPASASHAHTASYAITEITHEESSSHAQTADTATSLSGIPSIHVTDITASGDISASGNMFVSKILVKEGTNGGIYFDDSLTDSDLQYIRGSDHYIDINGDNVVRIQADAIDGGVNLVAPKVGIGTVFSQTTTVAPHQLTVRGEISASGFIKTDSSITASGDISASGTVIANAFVGNLTGNVTGEATNVSENLVVDNATLQLNTGIVYDGTNQRTISIKDGGVDSDALAANIAVTQLTVDTITNVNTTHITASGIVSASGIVTTTIEGTGTTTGFETSGYLSSSALYVGNATTFVSASLGNISASGTIIGSNLSGTNTGDQDLSSYMVSANTASFAITSSNVLFGHITASGNISSSGTVYGTNFLADSSLQVAGKRITYANNDLTFLDTGINVSGGHITASGNISASGDITADDIFIPKLGGKIQFAGDPQTYIGTTGTPEQLEIHADSDIRLQPDEDLIIYQSGTEWVRFSGDNRGLNIEGNITASGDISSSGNINAGVGGTGSFDHIITTGDTIEFKDGSSKLGTIKADAAGSITFGGDSADKASIKVAEVGATSGDHNIRLSSGNITASGNISASGNVIADVVYTDLIQSTGTSANLYTDSSFDELTIGYHGNLNSRLKINSHITASGNISASGEFIGHTFTHDAAYGAGRVAVLGSTPGHYFGLSGGDLGQGESNITASAVKDGFGAIVFNAPYSCSLERLDWMVTFEDATADFEFPVRKHAIKVHGIGNVIPTSVDLSNKITPDVNNFDRDYREGRGYFQHETYTGSANALLGPGDSLALVYSASVGGKLSGFGRCTATFRKIGE